MDMFTVFKEIDGRIEKLRASLADASYPPLRRDLLVGIEALSELKKSLEEKEAQYLEAMAAEYERFEREHA